MGHKNSYISSKQEAMIKVWSNPVSKHHCEAVQDHELKLHSFWNSAPDAGEWPVSHVTRFTPRATEA
jgi:hypothetical protein